VGVEETDATGVRLRPDTTAEGVEEPDATGVLLQPDTAAEGVEEAGRVGPDVHEASEAAYVCVYQSRSGRPEDPWLGPDVCDYLREARAHGLEAVVLCPAGFICDHIEVLYDLDEEAAAVCRDIGLAMARAETVNDHPQFLDMMADVVLRTLARYSGARPLPLTR
jgi:hypothetical protein